MSLSERDRLLSEHVGFEVTVLTSIKAIMQDAHGDQHDVPLSYSGEFVEFDDSHIFILHNDGSTVTVARKFVVAIEAQSEAGRVMSDPNKPMKGQMS